MARPNNYDKRIKPYLDDIAEMACTMSEEDIAKELCVGYSTFQRYKKTYEELRECLKKGRRQLVRDLKSFLIKKAEGYSYEETKIVHQRDEATGEMIEVRRETYIKYSHPDTGAIHLLLKNYDKDNWSNDPKEYELKKKAIELQERKLDEASWDV